MINTLYTDQSLIIKDNNDRPPMMQQYELFLSLIKHNFTTKELNRN